VNREQQLEKLLHEEIPLTNAIGVRVINYDHTSLTLIAPLANNINHKCTAFGGSLYAVAVLSGWGLLHLRLAELGLRGHIVIQQSSVKYLKPVTTDIEATATIATTQNFERFVKLFQRKGMARIDLESRVMQHGQVALEFVGNYVVHT